MHGKEKLQHSASRVCSEKELWNLLQMFRIFVVTLLVATVLWGVVFYETSQKYEEYLGDYTEQWWKEKQRLEAGIENGFIDPIFFPLSYWEWNRGGGIILVAGIVLLCAWILTAREKLLGFRKTN